MLAPVFAAVSAAGCSSMQATPPPDFKFAVTVESDPGVAMSGAVISRGGKEIARSDAAGKALLAFKGAEGETIDLYVKCPEDYLSPTRPISVRLSKLADDKILGETVRCAATKRKVVVSLRTDNAVNVPVIYFGREIARTDTSGAASFYVTGKPGETLQFTLDTSDKSFERLRPQSPQLAVLVGDHDEIYPLMQRFELQKQVVVTVRRQGPRPLGPQPLH